MPWSTWPITAFGAEGHPWIDLHWTFQVGLSKLYEFGGIPLLNVVKCLVTCLALVLLLSAKRRDRPIEVMALAWLPALILLGGRMYVRPETVSLLYLAAYLAILFRIEAHPRLAFALPVVQILWVNAQGLFILGPIVLTFALIDAAARPGAFTPSRKRWWRTVLIATALVGLACFVNPYGWKGAIYPLQLAATMDNPIFSRTIGELQPVSDFIKKAGLGNLPLQFHLLTIVLGALSFLLPILWRILAGKEAPPAETTDAKKTAKFKKSKKRNAIVVAGPRGPSLFRFFLFLTFTALSWQATRNSHQFAAVAGTVTAWNFGEWIAAIRRRNLDQSRTAGGFRVAGKFVVLGTLVFVFSLVISGKLYTWMGEGRTIGFGEEPLWFPRQAVEAAGRPGMPMRSICFHNGHAAYYEYLYAPERKTYADARLEVVGADVYTRYLDVQNRIKGNAPGWSDDLKAMGFPLVLVDNVHAMEAGLNATMLTAKDWRCVWFDPVAALYVHDSYKEAVERDRVDFFSRHFSRSAESESNDPARQIALAKAFWNTAYQLIPQGNTPPRPGWREAMRPLIQNGLDHARRVQKLDPDAVEGWKYAGLLEYFREPPADRVVPRFRMTFDPIQDISIVRATHDLVTARTRSKQEGNVLATLIGLYRIRGMNAEELETIDAFVAMPAASPEARDSQGKALGKRAETVTALGVAPSTKWRNLSELTESLNTLLLQGRAEAAADLLESAYPAETRPWEIIDRVATLRLHLGQAERARTLWRAAKTPPSAALKLARTAAASLVLGDFESSRSEYQQALTNDPNSFEALYGLAIVEFDSGRASEALSAARNALEKAPDAAAKSTLEAMIREVSPYSQK